MYARKVEHIYKSLLNFELPPISIFNTVVSLGIQTDREAEQRSLPDPPENCHLTVKKLPFDCQKIAI